MSENDFHQLMQLLQEYNEIWEKLQFLSKQNAFLQKLMDTIKRQEKSGLPLYIQDVIETIQNPKEVSE